MIRHHLAYAKISLWCDSCHLAWISWKCPQIILHWVPHLNEYNSMSDAMKGVKNLLDNLLKLLLSQVAKSKHLNNLTESKSVMFEWCNSLAYFRYHEYKSFLKKWQKWHNQNPSSSLPLVLNIKHIANSYLNNTQCIIIIMIIKAKLQLHKEREKRKEKKKWSICWTYFFSIFSIKTKYSHTKKVLLYH